MKNIYLFFITNHSISNSYIHWFDLAFKYVVSSPFNLKDKLIKYVEIIVHLLFYAENSWIELNWNADLSSFTVIMHDYTMKWY